MSTFNLAIPTILRQEGRYVNDQKDSGAATNYGISLRLLKKLGVMYGDIDLDGDIDADDIRKMTEEHAINIYREFFWEKYGYQGIISQIVATKLFSLSVNMGSKQAHKCLQRAVRAATGENIKDDGIIGPVTIYAVNNSPESVLLASLKSEAAGFYRILNNPYYLKGWLNRAYE